MATVLVFEWNALRVGDRVLVHDDLHPELDLAEGVVSAVETRAHGANDIGVRLDGHPDAIARPRRNAVHLLPLGASGTCWRCDAASTAPRSTATV